MLNMKVSYRIFFIFINPLYFAIYLIFPIGKRSLKLRTPIGKINVLLRNRESAKTLYSIFIREDYITDLNYKNILDLGSNIGISALYFLSRNKYNKILCFEPDPNNFYFLEKNLEKFKDRSQICFCAVGSQDSKDIEFNLSNDGKYSSLKEIPFSKLKKKIRVKVISIENALKNSNFNNKDPLLLKIDVEGLEKKIISSFDFSRNSNIRELIIEGSGYKDCINKKGKIKLINGLIEKYIFK